MKDRVSVAVEGPTDTEVLSRIFDWMGIRLGTVYGERGKGYLDGKLPAWNAAAKFAPWLVLRDLDNDADCAPLLIGALLPQPGSFMRLRISVRTVDAWLLADAEKLASFLAILLKNIPSEPDKIPDPKRTIVDLTRRSKKRDIREDIVPRPGTSGKVGPAFASRMIEFARSYWRPGVALRKSPSLRRCVAALEPWRS